MNRYFGLFTDRASILEAFEGRSMPIADFPEDSKILFAFYMDENYSGDAKVIFEKCGQLYEVEGSHCSCYGLEGQWKPGVTTWAALKLRLSDPSYCEMQFSPGAATAWRALVEKHT